IRAKTIPAGKSAPTPPPARRRSRPRHRPTPPTMAQPEARAPPPAQSVVRQFEGRPAVSAQRHSRLPPGRAAKPSGRYDWPSGEGPNKEQNSESGYTCARIRKNTAMSFTAPSHAAKEKRRLENDKKSEPKLPQKKGTFWCP